MSLIKRNIIANMIGNGLSVVLLIAFIPIYIELMGIEAFGLVGFYVTLQSLFAILDIGLTSTVSRELARLSVERGSEEQSRNLVRTLEAIYWGIATFIALTVVIAAPWIATKWLNGNQLSAETIEQSVTLMGIVIALRMPYGFYGGGLLGLQRQVLLNVVKSFVEALRSGGVVLILWLISPTITAFFLWQVIVAGTGALVMFFVLWRCLPKTKKKPVFEPSILLQLWRFMAGMSGIAVLAVILAETDKVILSRLLSLDEFAFYALASMVATGLNIIIFPVFSAVYPRFTQLVAIQDQASLKSIYHKSCQLMTVLVMPIALVVSFYSETLLHVWTQDLNVSSSSAPILSVLIVGTALNAMMYIPYALQLAHGWTRLSIYSGVIAIIVIIPMLLVMVSRYGAVGAASVWVTVNAGYIVFNLPIVHAKLLRGELKRWFIGDFGFPGVAALIAVSLFWGLMPTDLGFVGGASWIALTFLVSVLMTAVFASSIRAHILETARSWRLPA